MGITVTTDQLLVDSGIMIRSDFQRLTDKTTFPTGTDQLHAKARTRVLIHLKELPERIEEDDLTAPTQYQDAQLHYVAYQLFRRVANKERADNHFKWHQEEMSLVDPEIDGRETRDMKWDQGTLLERG